MYAFQEMLFRHWRYRDKFSGMNHSFCVLRGAKDEYSVVLGITEGFESFVTLLTVIQTGCHSVNGEVRRGNKTRRCPFATGDGVGRFNVSIDCIKFSGWCSEYVGIRRGEVPSRTLKPMSSQSAAKAPSVSLTSKLTQGNEAY
jgi:hypothetical protein